MKALGPWLRWVKVTEPERGVRLDLSLSLYRIRHAGVVLHLRVFFYAFYVKVVAGLCSKCMNERMRHNGGWKRLLCLWERKHWGEGLNYGEMRGTHFKLANVDVTYGVTGKKKKISQHLFFAKGYNQHWLLAPAPTGSDVNNTTQVCTLSPLSPLGRSVLFFL